MLYRKGSSGDQSLGEGTATVHGRLALQPSDTATMVLSSSVVASLTLTVTGDPSGTLVLTVMVMGMTVKAKGSWERSQ